MTLQPENRDLGAALRKIATEEVFLGDRSQRVLVITKTDQGYEVRARLGPKEVREGAHLSRVREIRNEGSKTTAIMHINLKGVRECALVHVLEEGENVYRLRPQSPPRPCRWVPMTDRMRERWDEVWGRL